MIHTLATRAGDTMDITFRSASTSLTAALLVGAFAPPCVQAQTTPGQIPQPWTYEGSKELQRRSDQSDQQQRQQQQQQSPQQYPSTPGSPQSSAPAPDMCKAKPVRAGESNPLIGRWRGVGPQEGRGNNAILMLAAAMACPAYDISDFRAKSILARGKEIPANYGRVGDVWWVCTADVSLGFRVANPNRLHMVDPLCAFERSGASPSAQSPAATGTGRPAQAAAAQTASTAASPEAAAAIRPGLQVLGVTLGGSSVQEVRQNIAARGARPLIGSVPGSQELRIDVRDRKYGDPRLANVWYDFENGVLAAVTILWAREPGAAPSLFNERAASLAQGFGLPGPQTAASLQGTLPGASIALTDEPAHGRVIERYTAPRQ